MRTKTRIPAQAPAGSHYPRPANTTIAGGEIMHSKRTAWLATAAIGALVTVTQASAADLDRAALIKLANDYFAAVVAHDPGKAPLASNVKTVENAKAIKPGEGLWKTTTAGPTEFRI